MPDNHAIDLPNLALLPLLEDLRMEIEQARAVSACVTGALFHVNGCATQDMATVLQSCVDNVLCEQVGKLDAAIGSLRDGKEVSHG